MLPGRLPSWLLLSFQVLLPSMSIVSRCVRVGYVVAPYTCCISCYCILRDRISEFLSSLILRETLVAVAPLIPSLHPDRSTSVTSAFSMPSPSLYRCSVTPSGRLPSWFFASFQVLLPLMSIVCRDMHVGYVVTIHNSRVILYRILGNCILNLGSCIFVLRQICEAPTPVVRCCYGLNLISQLCAICKQMNFNLAWTLAILIVIIVPGLASADIDSFLFTIMKPSFPRSSISTANLFPLIVTFPSVRQLLSHCK